MDNWLGTWTMVLQNWQAKKDLIGKVHHPKECFLANHCKAYEKHLEGIALGNAIIFIIIIINGLSLFIKPN